MERVYLDNNATTALALSVRRAMDEVLAGPPANPSSVHSFGQEARNILTRARRELAGYLAVRPSEIVFTSGATEALNTLLRGRGQAVASPCEHVAVLNALDEVKLVEPGPWGAPTPEAIRAALEPTTRVITVMAANNETGVMADLDGIAAVAEEAQVPLVVDGVALLGKESFTIPPGVSAICFSGHKIHGPPGSGFMVVRPTFKLDPLIVGGAQEGGRRGGTENLPAIVGLVEAVRLAIEEPAHEQMRAMRDRLEDGARQLWLDLQINGEGRRVSNTSNLAFMGVEGEGLLMRLDLDGVAVSHGSACTSGSLEPSRVLLGMSYPRERAAASLRFSLSRMTTESEIDRCLGVLAQVLPAHMEV